MSSPEVKLDTFRDRSNWGSGPWDDEPDYAHWVDPVTDMDCLIVRNDMGGLCGYAGVIEGHPAYARKYSELYTFFPEDLKVHGGLTYSDFCQEEGGHVCHVPLEGRPHNVWWLGFDCGHSCDMLPDKRAWSRGLGGQYRSFAYVKQEVESLAKQLKAAA